jgi:hypothetical protein
MGSSGFSLPRACGMPTNWRCQWVGAKPLRLRLRTWRAVSAVLEDPTPHIGKIY